MTKLKLGAIADEKPVKLTVELSAAVYRELASYAEIHGRQTGTPIQDPGKLIPANDRALHRHRSGIRQIEARPCFVIVARVVTGCRSMLRRPPVGALTLSQDCEFEQTLKCRIPVAVRPDCAGAHHLRRVANRPKFRAEVTNAKCGMRRE